MTRKEHEGILNRKTATETPAVGVTVEQGKKFGGKLKIRIEKSFFRCVIRTTSTHKNVA